MAIMATRSSERSGVKSWLQERTCDDCQAGNTESGGPRHARIQWLDAFWVSLYAIYIGYRQVIGVIYVYEMW